MAEKFHLLTVPLLFWQNASNRIIIQPTSNWRITSKPLTRPGPLTQSAELLFYVQMMNHWPTFSWARSPLLPYVEMEMQCTYLPTLVVSLAAPLPCIHNSHWSAVFNVSTAAGGSLVPAVGKVWKAAFTPAPEESEGKSLEFLNSSWGETSGLEIGCFATNLWEVSVVDKK